MAKLAVRLGQVSSYKQRTPVEMNPLGFLLFKRLSHYCFDVINIIFAEFIVFAPDTTMVAEFIFWAEQPPFSS